MKTLLEKTRSVNKIIQQAGGQPISFTEMGKALSENIGANVYIVSRKGKILGYAFMENFYCPTMDDITSMDMHSPIAYNDELLRVTNTQVNLNKEGACVFGMHNTCFLQNKFTTVLPIIGGGQRLGTLLLTKTGEFNDDDMVLAEYGAAVIGMEILRARAEKVEEIARQRAMVSIAFDTLSYSELEAVDHIFAELGQSNGFLVASKIADKVGITRSVIVNALRKLESAGLVEVRSLGMKGTYIRILNEHLMEEFEKLQSARR